MKQLFWKLLFIFYLIKDYKLFSVVTGSNDQCVGKHQIPFENLYSFPFDHEFEETIILNHFNVTPAETILENNDFTLVVNLRYSAEAPTINFGSDSGLDTYRFEFLYFQWYESSNETAPFELHGVFYNTKVQNFQDALKRKNMVVVTAFSCEVDQNAKKYVVLNKDIRSVQRGVNKISIKSHPLRAWLPKEMLSSFIMYEGSMPFFDCQPQVLWVDFDAKIILEPDFIEEVKLLETHSGKPLMKQFKTFVEPSGSLSINHGLNTLVMGSWGGIALVDADFLYNDDGEVLISNGASQKFQNIGTMFTLSLFLQIISEQV